MIMPVVVPALNEAHVIERTLSRLVAQDAVDEVIVVDNGSDDDTARAPRPRRRQRRPAPTSFAATSVDSRDSTRSKRTSSPRAQPTATIRSIRPLVGGFSFRRRSSASRCSRTRSPLRSSWVTSWTISLVRPGRAVERDLRTLHSDLASDGSDRLVRDLGAATREPALFGIEPEQNHESQPSRTPLPTCQFRLTPDERPRVDQLVLVLLAHHSRASYTEITTSTGKLRKMTRPTPYARHSPRDAAGDDPYRHLWMAIRMTG